MSVFKETLNKSENSSEEDTSDQRKTSSRKRKCCRCEKVAKRVKKASASILDLPDELLLEIFKKLPKNDTFFNVNRVCKRWNYLVKDKTLRWKKIEVGREGSTEQICKWILYVPFLQHLALNDTTDLDKIFITLSKNSKRFRMLEEPNRESSRVRAFLSITLSKLFKRCHRLQNLYFDKTTFSYFRFLRRSIVKYFLNTEWSYNGPVSYKQFRIFLSYTRSTCQELIAARRCFNRQQKIRKSKVMNPEFRVQSMLKAMLADNRHRFLFEN